MSSMKQKARDAYRNSYPDKLEENKDIKIAFWNGYMCGVVDEETAVIRDITEAVQYTKEEMLEAFTFND